MIRDIKEASSIAGTFQYFNKTDAENVGKMLGLNQIHQLKTTDGVFWCPGKSQEELMNRIFQMPQVRSVKTFKEFTS